MLDRGMRAAKNLAFRCLNTRYCRYFIRAVRERGCSPSMQWFEHIFFCPPRHNYPAYPVILFWGNRKVNTVKQLWKSPLEAHSFEFGKRSSKAIPNKNCSMSGDSASLLTGGDEQTIYLRIISWSLQNRGERRHKSRGDSAQGKRPWLLLLSFS